MAQNVEQWYKQMPIVTRSTSPFFLPPSDAPSR